jgi:glutaredoxin
MPELTLYHFSSCPFCVKVRNYLSTRGIAIPEKDIRQDRAAADRLFELIGGGQVPCLEIDGAPLLESDDIIRWFEENWK